MGILQTIGMVLLAVFAVTNIALVLYSKRKEYGFVAQIWRRYRWGMFIQAIGALLLVFAVAFTIWDVPGLKYGWLHLFYSEGGNVFVRPLQEGSESSYTIVRLLPVLFLGAFLFGIPFLAKFEEDQFRRGFESWPQIMRQSVKFGLIHCLAGIPLAAGIALIVSGLFYGYHYKRSYDQNVRRLGHEGAQDEAVMVSTAYHSMWNTIIVCVLLGFTVYAVFSS
ncbi:MAG: hypothetical protein KA066_00145 [Candidatus Pacebacteria bacterium]|nr:hypothetical protein [Candidatus Paceibacterota bacterium]